MDRYIVFKKRVYIYIYSRMQFIALVFDKEFSDKEIYIYKKI